jgi:hypothetical protein
LGNVPTKRKKAIKIHALLKISKAAGVKQIKVCKFNIILGDIKKQ